jgi:hypothetical protein
MFVRIAYLWLLVAATLEVWATSAANSSGIWGASRHALTVGFIATMVFCVGQRVLPASSGVRLLFSSKLTFAGLLFPSAGCILRVSGQVLAYQEIISAAWTWLPYSAILELSAVTVFAVNLVFTFMQAPALQKADNRATLVHNSVWSRSGVRNSEYGWGVPNRGRLSNRLKDATTANLWPEAWFIEFEPRESFFLFPHFRDGSD